MRAIDVVFALIIMFCAISVAVYILPTIKNEKTHQINAVLGFDLQDSIRYHLLSGQQLFDSNMRPVGIITSVYSINSVNNQNTSFTSWRMNATLTAADNNGKLSIAGTPLYYGTRLQMFTFDTEFYSQIISFTL